MKILLTGACGFIGHHFVEHIIKNTTHQIYVFDKLSYAASGFDRLRDINCFDEKRVRIFTLDFTKLIPEGVVREVEDTELILHLGAETHVDRSISNPEDFVYSNVVGTMHMLDLARKLKGLKRFVQFSTDEVHGPAPEGVAYQEEDRYNSTNPYSATKAGAEQLALAYANTYGLPVIITRTMNNFGERANPEKFIPLVVKKVLAGEMVKIHANQDRTRAGSRFWIHARNVADAVFYILFYAPTDLKGLDRVFNIVGEKEMDNLALAQFIAGVLGKKLNYEMVDFHTSRPGHDLRYALDGSKLARLGWEPPLGFEESLDKTIRWMTDTKNKKWLEC